MDESARPAGEDWRICLIDSAFKELPEKFLRRVGRLPVRIPAGVNSHESAVEIQKMKKGIRPVDIGSGFYPNAPPKL